MSNADENAAEAGMGSERRRREWWERPEGKGRRTWHLGQGEVARGRGVEHFGQGRRGVEGVEKVRVKGWAGRNARGEIRKVCSRVEASWRRGERRERTMVNGLEGGMRMQELMTSRSDQKKIEAR